LVRVAPSGGLDPLDGAGERADRAGQQPRVGRIGHVGLDHGGVSADLVGAQQLVGGGLGQQCLIELADRGLADPAGQLDQRRRMGHLPAQGDAAKPLPGDRVLDLAAQQLIAQPVAELEEHHPQVGLDRDRRAADDRVEVGPERFPECGVVQQVVDPGQLGGQPQDGGWHDRFPQAVLGVGGPQHHGSNPLWRKGSSRFFRHSTTQATQARSKTAGQRPLQGHFFRAK
jgi:hypothetical protein